MSAVDDGHVGGAVLMDMAKGTSVAKMIEMLPTDPASRGKEMEKLKIAVGAVGEGLAEMHAKLARRADGSSTLMTAAAKQSDADYFLDKSFRDGGRDVAQIKGALGEADFARQRPPIAHRWERSPDGACTGSSTSTRKAVASLARRARVLDRSRR